MIPAANRLQTVQEYYFSRKLKEIRHMRESGKDVINIGIGSPDLNPSKSTIQALISTAQQDGIHGYQSYVGLPELRAAMAHFYQQTYGVSLDSRHEILPLTGSKEGIMHISMAYLNVGDGVLVPNPGYLTYTSVSNLLGANIHAYPLNARNNWQPDWDFLENNDWTNTKILWLNYPNMPTGADAQYATFDRLIAFAYKHKLLIINDNPYSLILNSKPKSILQCDGAKAVALELNSLSKSHNMAGWRVGMLVGQADYLQNVLKVKSNMDSGMFRGIQKAAIKALHNSRMWYEQQNQIYARRKIFAQKILDELKCKHNQNQVGMFVWAKIPDYITNVEAWVDEILYRTHVFITPGFIFGSAGKRYVRISLCCTEKRLQEALKRIENLIINK